MLQPGTTQRRDRQTVVGPLERKHKPWSQESLSPPLRAAVSHPDPPISIGCDVLLEVPATLG